MAQSYTTQDGITLFVPNTYVSTVVKSGGGNLAAAGVVTLVGEADEGPAWVDEPVLDNVAFTPDAVAEVRAKYGSGRLVDAFNSITKAANDPSIVGGVSLVRMVKTNRSLAAVASVLRAGFGEFSKLTARREGYPGNLIKYKSEVSIAEVAPILSDIVYVPHYSGTPVVFSLRMNGETKEDVSVSQKTAPVDFCVAVEDYEKGILCTGGEEQSLLDSSSGETLTAAYAGGLLSVSLSVSKTFSGDLQEGDVVVIPASGDYGAGADSAIKGAGGENIGSYVVISFVNTTSQASMALKPIHTASTPVAASGAVDVGEQDIIGFKPVTIQNVTGQNRGSLVGMSGSFVATDDGASVTLTAPSAWTARPAAGDVCVIPATFAGIEAGFYMVSSATSTKVVFYRLSNGTFGTTSTENVVVPIVAGAEPVMFWKSVVDGVGKTLEVIGDITEIWFESDGEPASYSNSLHYSAAEYENAFTISRSSNSETVEIGGEIALQVRCDDEDATLVVDDTKVVGKIGATVVFTATFKQFKVLADLAAYITSFEDWEAMIPISAFGSRAPSYLDNGTFGATGATGWPCRIKMDAALWNVEVGNQSGLAYPTLTATAGLPEAMATEQFLAGGDKAGTSSAEVVGAIDAVEDLSTNFLVTLFSQDASADLLEDETETSSAYTIDAINAYAKGHALKMSKVKQRKNRIACVSKWGTYAIIREAAGSLSSFRVGMSFQKVLDTTDTGQIKIFQPWMGAVKAIGMQAAAGYKGIVKKQINISGVVDPEGFNSGKLGDQEKALKDGLLIVEKIPTGGFRWVSDQLTYSIDNNFVYNSLQAVYIADLMALTLMQRFDRLVVGKSVAEISAATALSILETEMFNFLRLRWIAVSDDAPKGFKNPSIKLRGSAMIITVEAKLAGLIYFVPISFSVSEVSQTA